jgi:hypothetical protein
VKYLESRVEFGTVQYIGFRVNGIGADHVLISNFRNIALVRAPDRAQHIRSQIGGNSIHTPSVIEVVGMDSGAKGKIQSNFASHIISLLTPRRKRNAQNPSQLRYGLNAEVENAGRLFGIMRDVDNLGIHTVGVVSNWNNGLRSFQSRGQHSVTRKADCERIEHVTDVVLWITIVDNYAPAVQIPFEVHRDFILVDDKSLDSTHDRRTVPCCGRFVGGSFKFGNGVAIGEAFSRCSIHPV